MAPADPSPGPPRGDGEQRPCHAVEDVVVARAHHRHRHCCGRCEHGEPRRPVPHHRRDGDARDQRPADVVAREGGHLVRPVEWVGQVVPPGVVADRPDEARHEARGCHRHEREQHDADRRGRDQRVAEPGHDRGRTERQEGHRDDEQRPVQPHVGGAHHRPQRVVPEHPALDVALDVDADGGLQVEEPLGVAHGRRPVTLDDDPQPEVREHGDRDRRQLAHGSGRRGESRRVRRNERHRAPPVRHPP